jgi:hypothetical protein
LLPAFAWRLEGDGLLPTETILKLPENNTTQPKKTKAENLGKAVMISRAL